MRERVGGCTGAGDGAATASWRAPGWAAGLECRDPAVSSFLRMLIEIGDGQFGQFKKTVIVFTQMGYIFTLKIAPPSSNHAILVSGCFQAGGDAGAVSTFKKTKKDRIAEGGRHPSNMGWRPAICLGAGRRFPMKSGVGRGCAPRGNKLSLLVNAPIFAVGKGRAQSATVRYLKHRRKLINSPWTLFQMFSS